MSYMKVLSSWIFHALRERGNFSRKKNAHISITIAHPETQNKRQNFMVPLLHLFWPPKDACTKLYVLQGIEIFTALYMCS